MLFTWVSNFLLIQPKAFQTIKYSCYVLPTLLILSLIILKVIYTSKEDEGLNLNQNLEKTQYELDNQKIYNEASAELLSKTTNNIPKCNNENLQFNELLIKIQNDTNIGIKIKSKKKIKQNSPLLSTRKYKIVLQTIPSQLDEINNIFNRQQFLNILSQKIQTNKQNQNLTIEMELDLICYSYSLQQVFAGQTALSQ